MDLRNWPWKKKSSDKTLAVRNSIKQEVQVAQYVQVSQEKYTHLSGLEDQVKVLNEKLSASLSEVVTKEDLIKQHTKVAEDAVSGWEKAEAEASELKSHLESLTLQKLTAEERAAHLDAALMECVKEVRNAKEEGEQKLQDVVFAKTRQWEKMKSDLEEKIDAFEHELLQVSAENDSLARTLEERSDMLEKLMEEKSQMEGEIDVLKANIVSSEREISSLKYELHVISKELEIRNEEKNMSMRSADAANKQHMEDVKKIAKLGAECNRLRGLVKKKLPGPAALAQMKHEVEGYGREYGDSCLRRSPARCSSSPHAGLDSDLVWENMQQCRRENELLTSRLLAVEEDNQMLKEALTRRNTELQASRSIFGKTASRLRNIEAQTKRLNQHESPSKHMIGSFSSHNGSDAFSVTSMSEDGIDEEGALSASSSAAVTPDVSNHRKQKSIEDLRRVPISIQMELMDDFLEMEKLACEPAAPNDTASISVGTADEVKCVVPDDNLNNVGTEVMSLGKRLDQHKTTSLTDSNGKEVAKKMDSDQNGMPISMLQAKISSVFDAHGKNGNLIKCCGDIRCILHDIEEELAQAAENCVIEEVKVQCNQQESSNGMFFMKANMVEDFRKAICTIHAFVVRVQEETGRFQGKLSASHVLDKNIEAFSAAVDKFSSNESSGYEVIQALAHVLSETREQGLVISCRGSEESVTPDCIDKTTLLENSLVPKPHDKDGFPDSSLNPPESPGEALSTVGAFSMKEFEILQKEKDNLAMDLVKYTENLDKTKSLLLETEQEVADLKSSLSSSEKSNGLAETQLRCMAESYRLLEDRLKGMEVEINQLHAEAETVSDELQRERKARQDDLDKYNDLQEEMERTQKTLLQLEADKSLKTNQEREIAAAAEKLAQCQETIRLLGRQFKTLQPQMELTSPSSHSGRHSFSSNLLEDANNGASKAHGVSMGSSWQQENPMAADNLASILMQSEEPPSENEANAMPLSAIVSSKHPRHRPSSSSSSITISEKQSRGFARFFSKGKSN